MTTIGKVRSIVGTWNSLERCAEIDKDTKIFLVTKKKRKKNEDLLLEATKMHEVISESL